MNKRATQPADIVAASDQQLQNELDEKVRAVNATLKRAYVVGLQSEIKTRKQSKLLGEYKIVSINLARPVKRQEDDE